MNMNATAQMITTTQVGCGKSPKTFSQIAVEAVDRERKRAKRKKKSNVPPEQPPPIGGYPVPPHTMTNRGHLRDIG